MVALTEYMQLNGVPAASSASAICSHRLCASQLRPKWAGNREIPPSPYRRVGSTLNSNCGAHTDTLHKLSTPAGHATLLLSSSATPARIFSVPPVSWASFAVLRCKFQGASLEGWPGCAIGAWLHGVSVVLRVQSDQRVENGFLSGCAVWRQCLPVLMGQETYLAALAEGDAVTVISGVS